jgi:hypothetical protein
MVQFFQLVFFIAAIVLIVLNVLEFNKWNESQKEAFDKRHSIKWFNFILTSLVAVGLALNIIIQWLKK